MMEDRPSHAHATPDGERPPEAPTRPRLFVPHLILTLLIFAGYALVLPDPPTHIVVTEAAVEDIVAYQAEIRGQPLSEAEVPGAIAGYVDDEVLLREAFRQGIDRGDPRVRSALLGASQFAVSGGIDLEAPDPAPDELEAFFRRDPDRYRRSEAVTLEVLTIPVGSLTEDESARILADLRAGVAPEVLVAPDGQLSMLRTITASMLSRAYGRAVGVPVFQAETGVWQGPLGSLQGIDFVRIVDRESPPAREFEEVAQLVEQDWRRSRLDDAVELALRDVRRRYRVELPEGARE